MKETREKKYYRIRVWLFWILVGGMILLFLGTYYKEKLYEKWLKTGGMEDVIYEGKSRLKNTEACYLCGNSDYSLVGYYRKFDTIGLISLNDWYVLDFRLNCQDGDGDERNMDSGTSSTFGNTGEIIYFSESNFHGEMASIEVTLPDDYAPKMETLEEYLCQPCLDKVLESLEFRKWKYEKKEAVPLCLIDFETLEIYSLQDWHQGYRIRDYWVEIELDDDEIQIAVYHIPE